MRYIFSFIEKVCLLNYIVDSLLTPVQEKQAENIVEKLCQRFRLSEDPRQWRDIAFCLSLLPFKSERSVKKLIEGLQFYRDKLHEETVFNRFTEILAKVRECGVSFLSFSANDRLRHGPINQRINRIQN